MSTHNTYTLAGQEPIFWLEDAKQLKKGADLIKHEIEKVIALSAYSRAPYAAIAIFKPYMLLSGLALENLVKGILIGRESSIVSSGKFNSKKLPGYGNGGHLTLEMVRAVMPILSEYRENLTHRLSNFVLWSGRYPIPMKEEKYDSPSFITTDLKEIDTMFEELSSLLEEERKNKPESW